MGENSNIQWTHHTFNPWIGCTKVSPGCANCYAETLRKRFGRDEWGPGKPRTRTSAANWAQPIRWDKAAAKAGERHRVFCASLADWLDLDVSRVWLADLLRLIADTPNLDWLLLSKRPENWHDRILSAPLEPLGRDFFADSMVRQWLDGIPPRNVWIGTTVEDQRRADERIPQLLSIPAQVWFVSNEPGLELVTLPPEFLALGQRAWCITGGESGRRARPFDISWARSVVAQCKSADVPVFVKQLGAMPIVDFGMGIVGGFGRVELRDSHGGDPAEWPADLRVREFPTVGGQQ